MGFAVFWVQGFGFVVLGFLQLLASIGYTRVLYDFAALGLRASVWKLGCRVEDRLSSFSFGAFGGFGVLGFRV